MASQTIHRQEKEQFIKLFEQDRIDRFEDRLAVLELFLGSDEHVTAPELAALVRQAGHNFSDDFVLETIELMCRYGFAQANHFDNGQVRYEHRHLGQHHDHLICTKCQKIIEFEDADIEQLQLKVAAAYGFHMLQHRMELYGICRQCQDQREQGLCLDAARTGERLRIVAFSGGSQSKLRLLSMGLRVGDEIEVITNIHQGQVVIALDFKRLVLGKGLAQKIRVETIRGAAHPAAPKGRS
ncbi:MAG: transcriptional repressor [Desulfobacterales bacterium]|nr:transcriptional repressor [Desulfobacterales bacterium]